MEVFGSTRKRANPAVNGGGGGAAQKRTKESEFMQSGIGSKSKPCTKFFSTSGCPFGENCHFLHYVPGGINAIPQMANQRNPVPPPPRNHMMPNPHMDGPPPSVKTKMCNKYNTAEGCKFGDKCHFAHGERELGRSIVPPYDDPRGFGPPPMGGRFGGHPEPYPPLGNPAASSFGASATAKISVDASLAGAIIGKGGVNSKQICRVTGAKLSIRDSEDPNLKNIELEGTFDQIKQASAMVRELIVNVSANAGPPKKMAGPPSRGYGNNFKTKLCEKFAKGACTFGERCHFAHGASELRKTGV